jgi:hypothetical protein
MTPPGSLGLTPRETNGLTTSHTPTPPLTCKVSLGLTPSHTPVSLGLTGLTPLLGVRTETKTETNTRNHTP